MTLVALALILAADPTDLAVAAPSLPLPQERLPAVALLAPCPAVTLTPREREDPVGSPLLIVAGAGGGALLGSYFGYVGSTGSVIAPFDSPRANTAAIGIGALVGAVSGSAIGLLARYTRVGRFALGAELLATVTIAALDLFVYGLAQTLGPAFAAAGQM